MNGYWSFPKRASHADIAEFQKRLENWNGQKPLLVLEGVEFHSFGPATTPDALCRYCWSPNLHTSTHCEKCGGPLVH